jgi:hypothetical protein
VRGDARGDGGELDDDALPTSVQRRLEHAARDRASTSRPGWIESDISIASITQAS